MSDQDRTITIACCCRRHHLTSFVKSAELLFEAPTCHCYQRRHGTGNICASYIDWGGWVYAESDLSSLSCYVISEDICHYFCLGCRTGLSVEKGTGSGTLSVPVGILQNASETVEFVGHECVSDTKDGGASDWLREVDGNHLISHPEGHSRGRFHALGERDWSLLARTDPENTDRHDVLEAKCLCGGALF